MFFLSALETCSFKVLALLNAKMRLQNIRLLLEFPYQSTLDESSKVL